MNKAVSKILVWMYSLVAAVVGGVGTAVSAVVAGQAIGAMDFTARQLGAVAIGGGLAAAAAYLKNSPLPKIDESA